VDVSRASEMHSCAADSKVACNCLEEDEDEDEEKEEEEEEEEESEGGHSVPSRCFYHHPPCA